ncbi:S24 family peptidase [Candidimonas nitroreducens]|uniref:Peptidase S24/S26A/S26B/S26C domain-containing protein n=1 Tax=Candidimonas nitroreducens TaxID=683354 RepID=A0A225MKZ6_9BURK|nr:S24 family peptidase [Candidimonas nitroreducens]OWT61996.1 hypothetical protein CEY11_09305 [Candidimonas nitroreducens]
MEPIISARRRNLTLLIRERYADSQSNFSDATGISLSQLGQWLSAEDSPHLRNMSERSARKIEKKAGLPTGWLDQEEKEGGDMQKSNVVTIAPKVHDDVTINRYDTGGSMGDGLELRDQPGIIQSWRVSPEWLERNVRAHSSAKNLCIVTGFGDSMQPLFNPGDPLLVDIGIKSVEFDSIYFFRVGNDGYVKRLQRIPTEQGLIIRAISENRAAYESFDIKQTMDFEVLGRVLKVWRSLDF